MTEKCKECRECALRFEREVPYRGTKTAEIVLVGEAPGKMEIEQGRCFVGPTGKRLAAELLKLKVTPDKIFFANAARCRIAKDGMSKKEINDTLRICRPKLEKALQYLKPKLIVAMGAIALQQVLKINKGVEKMKGKVIWSPEFQCQVLVVNHPAATLHDPSKLPQWQYHMSLIRELIDNNYKIKDVDIKGYKEVQSIDFLLRQKDITVAFDTEHQGLDWQDRSKPMLCYSVSDKPGTGYVVWFVSEEPDLSKAKYKIKWPRGKEIVDVGLKQEPNLGMKIREFRELMSRPDIKKIMCHGIFDLLISEKFLGEGYEVNGWVMDVQNAAHMMDENTYVMPSLNQLGNELTQMPFNQKMELSKDIDKADMLKQTRTPEDRAKTTRYASGDSDTTLQVGLACKAYLCKPGNERQLNYYVNFLQPALQDVMWPMQRQGIPINRNKIESASDIIKERLSAYNNECLSLLTRYTPKLVSKHQDKGLKLTRKDIIRDFLFDPEIGFGLNPETINKKSGTASVGKDDLKIIRDREDTPEEVKDLIKNLLLWGEYQVFDTRYIPQFKRAVKPNGFIYPSYSLCGTNTGRPNASDPNALNLPKRQEAAGIIRDLIEAPEGWNILAIDYSNAELRWIAFLAQDQKMMDVFLNDGDAHTSVAQEVLKMDWSKLTTKQKKEARQKAKAISFGYVYLMTYQKFVPYAQANYGVKYTLAEAEEYQKRYFETYFGIKQYHERQISFVNINKYVDSPYGRRRHLPMINSENYATKSLAERQSVNFPVQSPSSDSGLLAAGEAKRQKRYDPERLKIFLFVYDELCYLVKEGYEMEAAAAIKYSMENLPFERFGFKMTVPLKADVKIGKSLSTLKEVEL